MGVPRVAILTVSDRSAAGTREDQTGPALAGRIQDQGWSVVRTEVVPDVSENIAAVLRTWADSGEVDVILTTGGTGFASRDRTPEATLEVVDRLAPGLAEAIRSASWRTTPHALLARGVAGIRGRTLIVNLPGSPRGAKESLEVILPALPHAAELLREEASAEAGHAHRPSPKRA